MAMERVKGCSRENNNNSDHGMAVDRISKLPDSVIHHILSFVPTVDAVRMSVLSRHWRRMWLSVPTLQFPDKVGFERRRAFNLFVETCLKHRRRASRFIDGSTVTGLKLESYCSPEWFSGRSRWLGSNTLMNTIKELDLCLPSEEYALPSAVLNGRSLIHLKLGGYLEISACSVNLPSLKSMFLRGVSIDSETLYNLVIGCPSLEKCVLDDVDEYDIRISSVSLRFLEIEADCDRVQIKAINLQHLKLIDMDDAKLDFSAWKAIKDLTISGLWDYEHQRFEDRISELHLLENLTLGIDYNVEHINISSKSLQHFSLRKKCEKELMVTTETPNLVSFIYTGDMVFRMLMGPSYHPLKGQFFLWGSFDVMNFLSNVNCPWNSFDLCFYNSLGDLTIPKNLREISLPPWHSVKHLKVEIHCNRRRKYGLRKFFKQLAPNAEIRSIESKVQDDRNICMDMVGLKIRLS